jgi:hypothetical protein
MLASFAQIIKGQDSTMLDSRRALMGKAARLSSASMIRMVLHLPVLTVGRSQYARIITVGLLCLSTAACGSLPRAPSREIPTTPPELRIEIVEMPDTVCVGDVVTFVIKTTPGNECLGDIGYWNSKGLWGGPSFDPTVADRGGICQWTWMVTDDALPGAAEFRAGVRGYGTMSSVMPQALQIQTCDP